MTKSGNSWHSGQKTFAWYKESVRPARKWRICSFSVKALQDLSDSFGVLTSFVKSDQNKGHFWWFFWRIIGLSSPRKLEKTNEKRPFRGFSGFSARFWSIPGWPPRRPRLGFIEKSYQTGLNSQLCKKWSKVVLFRPKIRLSAKSEKRVSKSGVFRVFFVISEKTPTQAKAKLTKRNKSLFSL